MVYAQQNKTQQNRAHIEGSDISVWYENTISR